MAASYPSDNAACSGSCGPRRAPMLLFRFHEYGHQRPQVVATIWICKYPGVCSFGQYVSLLHVAQQEFFLGCFFVGVYML